VHYSARNLDGSVESPSTLADICSRATPKPFNLHGELMAEAILAKDCTGECPERLA